VLAAAAWPEASRAQQPPNSAAPSEQAAAPPARALLRTLTAEPRVAGTPSSLHAVDFLARELELAGYTVERETFRVMLSLPRRLGFAIHDPSSAAPLVRRVETWDADAAHPGDMPKFAGWTASGKVRAPVVHVGRGLRDDYRRLTAQGIDVRGAIALATFGGAYRGIKVDLAAEHGCVGVLLYTPSSEDGAARGAVWPAGPWKPGSDAQRGSISPMGRAPGDPSTPGWPSTDGCLRLDASAFPMPRIPCLPIGWDDAQLLLERLKPNLPRLPAEQELAAPAPEPIGPGPVEVELDIDAPTTLRPIVNVIGTLPGSGSDALVVAGSHRDSWVRGANDSGGGCIALLRAAQRLGARHAAGWKQHGEIQVCFWDAEEQGLIGSTEHVEAHAEELSARLVAYVNSDANVGGPRFGASGTPGLMRVLREAVGAIDSLAVPGRSLWDEYTQNGTREPTFGLPGSGSDFAGFLHHLGLPLLELGFHGNSGGQYHTTFDDFELVERFLDPGFVAHEKAGEATAALLARLAERGRACFDAAEAAREMARHARLAGLERDASGTAWLGVERAERLALAFEELAKAPPDGSFYARLCSADGLPGRAWFRNVLWAPGLETGYSSETWPLLRAAARAPAAATTRAPAAALATAPATAPDAAPAAAAEAVAATAPALERALDALCASVRALRSTDARGADEVTTPPRDAQPASH
jgi:N-acetylated-alpha-linked acidic dipeptidase